MARAQREMGEVQLSLDSYKKAIELLGHAESLSEEEKKEIIQERHELAQLLDVPSIVCSNSRTTKVSMESCRAVLMCWKTSMFWMLSSPTTAA